MSKDLIRIDVCDPLKVNYELPTKPKEFIEYFQNIFSKIPEEFYDSATVELEPVIEIEDASMTLDVYYLREETKEEIAEKYRIEEINKDIQKRRELATLKKLKEKYEK